MGDGSTSPSWLKLTAFWRAEANLRQQGPLLASLKAAGAREGDPFRGMSYRQGHLTMIEPQETKA
jgi:hypothetical protein